ncbi:MAG: hypothetical protein ACE5GE_14320, partial [Phycisphaerae bacterium]
MTQRQRQAVELYQKGLSCSEVGKEIGCCGSAVSRLLSRAGHKARPRCNRKKWDAKEAELRFLYYERGMSQQQIAEYFRTTQALIYKIMKRLKIKTFSPGRRKGAAHHNFKHGRASRLYRTVIEKDKCRRCGTTESLGIHHKNDDHYDNRLENLEVLCNSCHM